MVENRPPPPHPPGGDFTNFRRRPTKMSRKSVIPLIAPGFTPVDKKPNDNERNTCASPRILLRRRIDSWHNIRVYPATSPHYFYSATWYRFHGWLPRICIYRMSRKSRIVNTYALVVPSLVLFLPHARAGAPATLAIRGPRYIYYQPRGPTRRIVDRKGEAST